MQENRQVDVDDDPVVANAMRLQDLIDPSKLQSLMTRFHVATGFPAGILDPDGKVLVAVGWQRICVDFHRANPDSCRHCQESDALVRDPPGGAAYTQYKCRNGLWDIAIPIMLDDVHLATLFMGQFLFEDEGLDRSFFAEQATRYGFDQADYFAALEAVPRYGREKVKDIVAFYAEFAEFIVALAASNAKAIRANLDLESKVQARTLELAHSEQRFRRIVQSMPLMVFAVDGTGHILFWNYACARLTGYTSDEVVGNGRIAEKLYPDSAERDQVLAAIRRESADFRDREFSLTCKDGTRRRIVWSKISGEIPVSGWDAWAIGEDVTERNRAQRALSQERDLFKSTIDSLPGVFYLISPDLRFASWNDNLERLSGYTKHEIACMSPLDLFGPAEQPAVATVIQQVFAHGEGTIEASLIAKDGSARPFSFSALRTQIDGGSYLTGVGIDIADRKQLEDRLQLLATTDELTGIANRRQFRTLAQRELNHARRHCRSGGMLMLDVDYFKRVNDTGGHAFGDLVLREIAKVLGANLREVDIIGRYGGEEFAVYLPEAELEQALVTAERMRQAVAVASSEVLAGGPQITISVGVAVARDLSTYSLDDLLASADRALYRAKQSGRNRVETFAAYPG